jgi:hypothetical protein
MKLTLPDHARDLSDEEWLQFLIRSVTATAVDGIDFRLFVDSRPYVFEMFVGGLDLLRRHVFARAVAADLESRLKFRILAGEPVGRDAS